MPNATLPVMTKLYLARSDLTQSELMLVEGKELLHILFSRDTTDHDPEMAAALQAPEKPETDP